jgi:hypothetical protein
VLRTGIMAIGGETTGTIISAKGKTYELDFRKSPKLRALAEKLDKKEAIVQGTLRLKRGIEIKERRIIAVTDLRPANAQEDAPPSPKPAGDTTGSVDNKLQPSPAAEEAPMESRKKTEPIRKLTVEVDPILGSKWSEKPGVRIASDEKELTKLVGEATAKQIAGKIDFAKENLVHVAGGSAGPPFGTLRHETKDGKEGKAITFFVRQPKTLVQGQAFRMGNDFFTVPKKANVQFGGAR